jgi:hypothetical protein
LEILTADCACSNVKSVSNIHWSVKTFINVFSIFLVFIYYYFVLPFVFITTFSGALASSFLVSFSGAFSSVQGTTSSAQFEMSLTQ